MNLMSTFYHLYDVLCANIISNSKEFISNILDNGYDILPVSRSRSGPFMWKLWMQNLADVVEGGLKAHFHTMLICFNMKCNYKQISNINIAANCMLLM